MYIKVSGQLVITIQGLLLYNYVFSTITRVNVVYTGRVDDDIADMMRNFRYDVTSIPGRDFTRARAPPMADLVHMTLNAGNLIPVLEHILRS